MNGDTFRIAQTWHDRISLRPLFALASAMLVLAGAGQAAASTYPERPIRLVVPYSAGGTADSLARRLAESLRQDLQQTVIVENRPGANTAVGATHVASSVPDGYTLLLATAATAVLNPMLVSKLRYQPEHDFTGVANLVLAPLVLSVNAAGPLLTLADVVRQAKASPGKLAFGSTGVGSSTHLAMELLQSETGTSMNHAPYNGSAPALNALMAGDVQVVIDSVPTTLALVKGNKVRAIAVTTQDRVSALAQTSTVAETGLAGPGYNVSTWYGILAPSATPRDVVARLNQAIVKATNEKVFRDQFEPQGVVVSPPFSPSEFNDFINRERALWRPIIQSKNIQVE